MRKIIIVMIALMTVGQLNAQIDKEIAGFVDSTEQLAQNGKMLLLKSLQKGDLNKAKEVYNYLDDKVNNNRYSAFSFTEELYVLLLTDQLDLWTDRAKKSRLYLRKLIYPNVEDLSEDFYYMLKDRLPFVEGSVERSKLNDEDKEMIMLFAILVGEGLPGDRYKRNLKSFKQKYPITEYKYFLELYLPGAPKKVSYSYVLGGSGLLPTGSLANTLEPGAAFLIDFSVTVDRFYFGFYAAAGNLSLKEDVEAYLEGSEADPVPFYRGDDFYYTNTAGRFGYSILDEDKIILTPYLNVGFSTMESPTFDMDSQTQSIEVFTDFSAGPGFRAKFVLAEFEVPTFYGTKAPSRLSFIVDGGYNLIFSDNVGIFKGDMGYLGAGISWGIYHK
ncbi:MAG: hypothetical protein C0599_13780 [Salinivirgaceae bacterium]|nr:MAG: hypothetical protein C0599_13780 [Salinivirgaceae bacterium]